MIPSILFCIEIIALILFFWGFLELRKCGTGRVLEYFMIFVYALVLEELDMRIFKTYHYSPDFFFLVGQVPVCIALLWAVILAGSMALSDFLGLPRAVRPFADAVFAVWLDLSLDAIAIRLEFWSWVIPLDQGWFGVPAGNLYAWMWVAFCFSALARMVRLRSENDARWLWAYAGVPFFAYAGLFTAMTLLGFLGRLFGLASHNDRLLIFWVQLILFIITLVFFWHKRRIPGAGSFPRVWRFSRLSIHLFFLAVYFLYGMYKEIPMLGLAGVTVFLGEILFMLCFTKNK